jgi:CheY-like chemotaxis protein
MTTAENSMSLEQQLVDSQKFRFNETSFKYLMQRRIYKVLIICSNYDFFMLEEDGRIDEMIFREYVSLNLRYPPVFLHANKTAKALRILKNEKIDLVITMLSADHTDIFELSRAIKNEFPHIPIVALTHFSREISLKLEKEELGSVDYVFSWLGHTDLLLAIIKLIEDQMNVAHDVQEIGVQTILMVEDSIRYYSSYLPIIYKIILKQSHEFQKEGLNEYREMLRMRGRPKLLFCTTYEEAVELFERYKENCLGVISDIAYAHNGKKDNLAGIKLAQHIKTIDPHIPILLQSSDYKNKFLADDLNVGFLYKYSKSLIIELRNYVFTNLAFGDFLFKNKKGEIVDRASDLNELQEKVRKIPVETLEYHFNRNDFSRWLNARALFPIAKQLKYLTIDDFESVEVASNYIYRTIASYRLNMGRGVISKFDRKTYSPYIFFARIGEGQIGGKARGLAFIDSFIKRNKICCKYKNTVIAIPRTVVLSTDVFDEFMDSNHLYQIALDDSTDDFILQKFLECPLPQYIYDDLWKILEVMENPIAVRSSSVLEDSHYQPFAGIYSTYMVPNVSGNKTKAIDFLAKAIKSVYASVYFKSSKAYMAATSNVIDEEKMAIILQEVTGKKYGHMFYPTFSGVARSINFYPIEPETPADGIANIALGLGKIIVDGGVSLRFSPKYPKKVLQLSSTDMALRDTQKYFYALNLDTTNFLPSTDDSANLLKKKIKEAEMHRSINQVASTYDYHHHMIRAGANYQGLKIITFANILQYDTFPLADILQDLLKVGQKEMNNPIEIEFAVDLDTPADSPKIFSFLQIRPIVESQDEKAIDLSGDKPEDCIIMSKSALGNGLIDNIFDIVYVKPASFNAANSREIGEQVSELNEMMVAEGRNYILIGPGRWGSSDPWLGIPVKWSQISAARLIIEAGLEHYRIDPSQGTHFFQNLTSFHVGYFTINPYINDGYYDIDFLNKTDAVFENEYLRLVRFQNPMVIKIDGKANNGNVLKP